MSDKPLAEPTPAPQAEQSSTPATTPAQSTASAPTQPPAAALTPPAPATEVHAENDVAKLDPDKTSQVGSLAPKVPTVAIEPPSTQPSQPITATVPAAALPQPEAPVMTIPASAAVLPDIENPYILSGSGEIDRARLVAQTRLFKNYVERNAKNYIGQSVQRILDIGCGEGQLTVVFAKLYPEAQIIGIDNDVNAIAEAQRNAKGIPNVKFEVGDILQNMPIEPFDLVYASMVLEHIPNIPKVLKNAFDILTPGGSLWVKDPDESIMTAIDHPSYRQLTTWISTAMSKIGASGDIVSRLPKLLTASGFTDLRTESESYPMGNNSTDERISMLVTLGAFYNTRKMLSKVLQVAESDVEKAYRDVIAAMTAPGGPRGAYRYVNTIARRPKIST